jgi:hypothetical protein
MLQLLLNFIRETDIIIIEMLDWYNFLFKYYSLVCLTSQLLQASKTI